MTELSWTVNVSKPESTQKYTVEAHKKTARIPKSRFFPALSFLLKALDPAQPHQLKQAFLSTVSSHLRGAGGGIHYFANHLCSRLVLGVYKFWVVNGKSKGQKTNKTVYCCQWEFCFPHLMAETNYCRWRHTSSHAYFFFFFASAVVLWRFCTRGLLQVPMESNRMQEAWNHRRSCLPKDGHKTCTGQHVGCFAPSFLVPLGLGHLLPLLSR